MEIKIDVKGIDKATRLLGPQRMTKVLQRTLSRLGKIATTKMTKTIHQRYNITQKRTKKAIYIKKPSYQNLTFTITARGKPPGLQHYKARKTKRGVTVKVLRQGPRKLVKKAFLAYPRKGGVGIFRRKGKKRYPLVRLYGPSVVGMMNVVGKDAVEKAVNENAQKIFDQQLKYEYSKK